MEICDTCKKPIKNKRKKIVSRDFEKKRDMVFCSEKCEIKSGKKEK